MTQYTIQYELLESTLSKLTLRGVAVSVRERLLISELLTVQSEWSIDNFSDAMAALLGKTQLQADLVRLIVSETLPTAISESIRLSPPHVAQKRTDKVELDKKVQATQPPSPRALDERDKTQRTPSAVEIDSEDLNTRLESTEDEPSKQMVIRDEYSLRCRLVRYLSFERLGSFAAHASARWGPLAKSVGLFGLRSMVLLIGGWAVVYLALAVSTMSFNALGPTSVESDWRTGAAMTLATSVMLLVVLLRRYRRLSQAPQPLRAINPNGPQAIAMPAPVQWPPLFTNGEIARLRWGVGRTSGPMDSEDLDAPDTIEATIENGGLLSTRFRPRVEYASVWILEDIDDRSILKRPIVAQLKDELVRLGVPFVHWELSFSKHTTVPNTSFTGTDYTEYVQARGSVGLGHVDLSDFINNNPGLQESAVFLLADPARLTRNGALDAKHLPVVLGLRTLPRFTWVDPARKFAFHHMIRELGLSILLPENLPGWLAGDVHERVSRPLAKHVLEIWAGCLLRYRSVQPPSALQAWSLAQAIDLPGVRAIALPELWMKSTGARFTVSELEKGRLRRLAKVAASARWRRAAKWWQRQFALLRATGELIPEWKDSRASRRVEVGEALLLIEEAIESPSSTRAALSAAIDIVYRNPEHHEQIRYKVGSLKSKEQLQWKLRDRQLWISLVTGSQRLTVPSTRALVVAAAGLGIAAGSLAALVFG